MGSVGALVGLAGAAVVVFYIGVVFADHPAQQVVVLLLVGTFHALEVRHIRAPRVQTGAGAVHAGLGVVACTGRPYRIAHAAIVHQHLILDRLHRLADGIAGRGRDLIDRGVDQRIGGRTVLFVVFQIRVDGYRLRLPRLLRSAGADIAANGAKLGIGDAHQTVLKIQRDIALEPLPLDVQVGHGDLILGAKQPAETVFVLSGDQSSIGPADGGGSRSRCRRDADTQHRRQQKRRRAAGKRMQMFQSPVPSLWAYFRF